MTRRVVVLAAVLLLGATPARGQPLAAPEPAALRGESAQTRKRLAEAHNKLLLGKHAEAIDELHRVLEESGDDLIPIDDPRANLPHRQYRPARWVAQHLLTLLPPDALRTYQDRIDEPARKLLEAGRRERDPRPLWQLLDRYFVSRPAQDALLLLGDLMFERGQFHTAELLWRRLLQRTAERYWERLLVEDPDIPYPGPTANPAAVRARVALAVIFQGEPERARQELVRLAVLHPDARGPFAGRDGPYAEVLVAFLANPPRLRPDVEVKSNWPTFGGSPSRSGRAPGRMPSYWPDRPTWTKGLFSDDPIPRGPASTGRQPFGHPVILDGKVYVTDGARVRAFDLRTGDALGPRLLPPPEAAFSSPPQPQCFTLTAAEGRLFARLGPAVIRNPELARAGPRAFEESALVCFAPNTGLPAREVAVREVWRITPPMRDGLPTVWEGAPLVANGRMWAALVRFEGGRTVHAIACFDPADPDRAPDHPAWIVDVCDAQVPATADLRTRHELLTLAGRNVVFCSNTGAVVAVDAATGRKAWAFRYPRSAQRAADVTTAADPTPAVAVDGRVFVAPADADHVYALDEQTGQLLWESGTVEGAQLLGVTRHRVIISVAPPIRGIRGLSVANGSYRPEDGGWIQHDGGGSLGYGRGLVTDDLIIWPTREALFFLDPETGRQVAKQRHGQFGNLAYADGVLVVVTSNEVRGYVAPGGAFDPRPPENPERQRFDGLIGAAERELEEGDPALARAHLLGVARSDLPPRMRAWAAARLLLLAPIADDFQQLPADVRAVLVPELETEWVVGPDGAIVTLGTLIAQRTGQKPPAGSKPENPTRPADRTRADAPTLSEQSCIDRSVRLPPTACPLRPIPGAPLRPRHLFVIAGPELLAVPLNNGGTTNRVAAGIFTHAADLDGGFVAVGPHTVAVYGVDREPAWVFRVPDLDSLPERPGRAFVRFGEPEEPSGLSSFVLAGPWLFARLGEHHLVALDLHAQRVGWVLGAHGRPRYEPLVFPTCPRFEPHFFVSSELLLVQLSDGRRWCVRAASGRVLDASGTEFRGPVPAGFGDETARAPWPAAPVEIEPGRLTIADGPGLVRLLDLDTGKASPLYVAEGSASLTGDPPQVRAWGGTVLVAVRRNHGVELDRVEPNGRPMGWAGGPAFFDASRIDLSAADADAVRVYIPAGDRLFAVNLRDGSAVWDVALPKTHGAGGWVVRAGKKAVIVYPEFAIPSEPVAGVWNRAVRSFPARPLGWRLPGLALGLYDAWVDRAVPVLLFDPQTGELLKRIDLTARGPAVTAFFEGDLAVIATGDRVMWIR